MTKKKIFLVGPARGFHTMDWYRTIKRICSDREVILATDLVESEGHPKLVTDDDNIIELYNIDRLLLKNQSAFGNLYRNAVKALAVPVQAWRLKRLARANPDAVYHAHTMYYLWVSWLAGIRYVGTPQGDEILIRPYRSRVYKFFATKSLRAADHLIVDSENLRKGVSQLSGKNADVIQNGIDVAAIRRVADGTAERTKVVSIRALYPLYRIEEILRGRDATHDQPVLHFFYPYWEDGYRAKILDMLRPSDHDLGRLPTKTEVYSLLNTTVLAVSIPESDSSPRSVYEAIFCGCCVAVTYNPWIATVPACMRARIFVVDLGDRDWLEKAIRHAESVVATPYVPSDDALNMFDQERSMRAVANRYYI